jgi:uncharacterized protein (TIGR02266 family)
VAASRLLVASRRDLAVPIPVEVRARAVPARVEYATNLSVGGLCLHAREPLPVGEGVAVAFALPGGGPPIEARGRVIWREEAPPTAAARWLETGIRFEVLADADRERLARFVRECDPDAAPGADSGARAS